MKTFEVKKDHIDILGKTLNMVLTSNDRTYDIYRIIGKHVGVMEFVNNINTSNDNIKRANAIHDELKIVLNICIDTQLFKAGVYEYDGGHWKLINNTNLLSPNTLKEVKPLGLVGWICPICGDGLSPFERSCFCNKKYTITC